MKTVINAVNEFKGEWPNGAEHLVCNQSKGSINTWYHSRVEEVNFPLWSVLCSAKEFLATVLELQLNFGKCTRKEWFEYTWSDKELLKSIVVPKSPSPRCVTVTIKSSTPAYTQEMADNGVLPSVGMEVVVSFIVDSNNKQVGKVLFISDEYVIIKDKSCEQHYFRSSVNLLPVPPITLIDGECYQFNSPSGGLFKGYYIPTKGLFVAHRGNFDAHLCTNIQPLTVEVK